MKKQKHASKSVKAIEFAKCAACATAMLLAIPAQAALLSVDSYAYTSAPHPNYPDSGGELTDGVAQNIAWGNGNTITVADVQPLVGWLGTSPGVTFSFATPQIVEEIVVWVADSNGSAGVAVPQSIRVTTIDGFDQNFLVTDPAGAGMTVPISLGGFTTTSSSFSVTAVRSASWTMLSEVLFFDEPTLQVVPVGSSVWTLFAGLLGWAACRSRRRGCKLVR